MPEAATPVTGSAEDIKPVVTADPAPAPAAPESKPAPTALDPSTDDDPVKHPTNWPENWRQLAAGEDEKAMKKLERYASPSDVAKALIEAQARISKGLTPKKPGDDATEEQKAAWREMLGVPAKVEDYFAALPEGLVIGDDDKELFSEFGKAQLEAGASKESVQNAVKWYYDHMDKVEQENYNQNKEAKAAVEDFLLEEYGNERKAQIANVVNLLNSLPEGAGELLQHAAIDGVALLNHPEAMKALIHISNELNPVGTVIPGQSSPNAMGERKAELESIMSTDRERWFKTPELQTEYQKILQAEEKLKARAS